MSAVIDMPAAAVTMVGSDHVYFAASVGIGEVDMGRDVSFCAHGINQEEVMVVPDATADVTLLCRRPHPVSGRAGPGGSVVIDSNPHEDFSQADRDRLRQLADMAAYSELYPIVVTEVTDLSWFFRERGWDF